jgi:hypothetical protein
MGGDKLLAILVPGLSDEDGLGKTLSRRRAELFTRDELPYLRATPGARALIERWSVDGLTMVVATSAQPDEIEHFWNALVCPTSCHNARRPGTSKVRNLSRTSSRSG